MVYIKNNALKRHLKNKDKIEQGKYASVCVYRLIYNCSEFFVSETGRSFQTQCIEHIKAFTQSLI